jgi:hypothetical protein
MIAGWQNYFTPLEVYNIDREENKTLICDNDSNISRDKEE